MARFGAAWGLTGTLGGDLIPNIGVGIAELIKNGYDADATSVKVDLTKSFEKKLDDCVLLISDDGHGMSKQELEEDWFMTGYSRKTEFAHRVSPKGRLRTGAKGVGRFALQKIGKKVILITRSKDGPTLDVRIDWDAPDNSQGLSEIDWPIGEDSPDYLSMFSPGETGTFLLIEDFRVVMNASRLQSIHKAVQTLINPFDSVDDFDVDMRVPESKRKWSEFGIKQIAEWAQYRLSAKISGQGTRVEYEFVNQHPWDDNNGNIENGSWDTEELLGEKCLIKSTEIWIYYLSRLQQLRPAFTTGTMSKKEMNEITGFRLYRGKHRIFPYGEVGEAEGGDWLGLTAARHNSSKNFFSHEQLVAAACVNQTANPSIKDQANRNGLHENAESQQLVKLLRAIVKAMKTRLCNPIPKKEPKNLQPPAFTYQIGNSFQVGTRVSLKPSNKASKPTGYSISEKLPSGMTINKNTGDITGTPVEAMENVQQYAITGKNKYGQCSFTLYIEVKEQTMNRDEEEAGVNEESSPNDILIEPTDDPSNTILELQPRLNNAQTKLRDVTTSDNIDEIRELLESAKQDINRIIDSLDE